MSAKLETDAEVVAILEALAENYRIEAKTLPNLSLAKKVAIKVAAKAIDREAARRLKAVRKAQKAAIEEQLDDFNYVGSRHHY